MQHLSGLNCFSFSLHAILLRQIQTSLNFSNEFLVFTLGMLGFVENNIYKILKFYYVIYIYIYICLMHTIKLSPMTTQIQQKSQTK